MINAYEYLTSKKEEQEPDFMTYTGGEEGSFGLDDLAADHNYNVIEKQMMSRFGMSEKTYDRQEVIDKWVNYNRKFNVGNTLSVLGEATGSLSITVVLTSTAGCALRNLSHSCGAAEFIPK